MSAHNGGMPSANDTRNLAAPEGLSSEDSESESDDDNQSEEEPMDAENDLLTEEEEDLEDEGGDKEDDDNDENEKRKEDQDEKHLADLQKQIQENPYGYDLYVQLIILAKNCGELEVLRGARQQMSELFPLTEEMWKAWIADEKELMEENDAVGTVKITSLYERSVKDYISVDLWQDYAMFSLKDLTSEESLKPARVLFERAITAVGLHVSLGGFLWDSYRKVEQNYLCALISQHTEIPENDKQLLVAKQTDRVKELFKRQLSVPLNGMEQTFEECITFFGGKIDPNIERIYKKAKAKLDEVMVYENEIDRADDNAKYGPFTKYINYEIGKKEGARVVNLFERALVKFCLSADLWSRYLDFLNRTLKDQQASLDAHERSIRNLPWATDLWLSYLRTVELFDQNFTKVHELFKRALGGCALVSDYVDVWLAFLLYLRRRLPSELDTSDTNPAVIDLRRFFEEAVADVQSREADPERKIARFWASIEAESLRNMTKSRELWESVMRDQDLKGNSGLWMSYFLLERRYGDASRCRKVLKAAMLRKLDNTEAIAHAWMQFEGEVGTLQSWFEANDVCKESIKKAAARQAKALLAATALPSPRKNHRLRDPSENPGKPRRDMAKESQKPRLDKRKHPDEEEKSSESDGFKVPALPVIAKGIKKQKVETPTSEVVVAVVKKIPLSSETPEGNKEERTIFLKNLSYTSTEEAVWNLFHTAGEIRDIRFGKDAKTGNSRGFCYVEFVKKDAVDAALKLDRHDLDGRPVFVCRDGERESHYKGGTGEEKNKLFIRGLTAKIIKEDLIEAFGKFGKLKDARIVTHKSGVSKGIAYLEFADAVIAAKALEEMNGKEIDGKPMVIAISNPPARPPKASNDRFADSRLPSRPSSVPTADGQRKSRSQINAFVPRSVLKKNSDDEIVAFANGSQQTNSEGVAPKKNNNDFRALLQKKF